MKNIGKYVEKYDICLRIKNRVEIPTGKLIMNKVPERP